MAINTFFMRSPFFRVRIGPPNAQPSELHELPQSVYKLIDSFEYMQLVDGGQGSASKIKLTFIEGSTQGKDRPGSLLDLQFDAKVGIRSVSNKEVKQSIAKTEELQIAEIAASKIVTTNVEAKADADKASQQVEQEIINNKKTHTFVLQEGNTIEVTWGYRETGGIGALSSRVAYGEILRINHRATGDSMPVTEVDALDLGSGQFSKLRRAQPKAWTISDVKDTLEIKKIDVRNKFVELDKKSGGNFWVSAFDAPKDKNALAVSARIDGVVTAIAAELPRTEVNIQLTPEELQLDTQVAHSTRTHDPSTSLHEYLKEAAEKLYAHYYVTRKTNKDGKTVNVINLVSRTQFESTAQFHFGWKSGGSESPSVFNTMTTYNLSLLPNGGDGASSQGVDSENKTDTGSTNKWTLKYSGTGPVEQRMIQSDPEIAKATNSFGISEYNESSSTNDHKALSTAYAGRMERSLLLTFTTVGVPQLSPGAIKVLNIGNRYSGIYYAFSVTHKMNSSDGYLCTVMANSNALAAGGVSAKNENPVTTQPPDVIIEYVKDIEKSREVSAKEVTKGDKPATK